MGQVFGEGIEQQGLEARLKRSAGPAEKICFGLLERVDSSKFARVGPLRWFKENELQVMGDCMWRMHTCSWWEWKAALTLFFWNWPVEFRLIAGLGIAPWMKHSLKHWRKAQPVPKDEWIKAKIIKKLEVVQERLYLEKGKVSSL
jgi:hypothetical protein